MFDFLKPLFVLYGVVFSASLGISGGSAWAAAGGISGKAETAIEMTKTADMSFGTVIPDASAAGTIVVSTAGVRTCAPVLTCSGTVSAAGFNATGSNGLMFALTLPPSANIASGADTMLIDNFVSSIGTGDKFKGSGIDFTIGGTLNVGISQSPGNYTGTYTVMIEYN